MTLTSLVFTLFCVITLIIYFIIPKKFQWIVLLISSLIFLFYDNLYISTIIQALMVLIPSYILGRLIEKNYDTKKAKIYLIIGIIVILGQLIYLKYTNLFLATANHICNLFKIDYQFEFIYRNSLIGISYYSLIMISYLVDIYRGTCKSQKNLFKCALFMSYFPILTSGPFIRYEETGKELYKEHKFNYDAMCKGLIRIFWGLFKILVISQRIGYFVDGVYGDLNTYSGVFVIIAVLLYTMELFTNFSGSIDVIMGVSKIMGIKLPENFTLPFASRTMTEFWRHWHITLGAWLRDYIFYPLQKSNFMQNLGKKAKKKFGKKKGKKISVYVPMLIMWICIGVWHGGAYTFIIGSGLLQFLYIFLEDVLEPVAKKINGKLGIDSNGKKYKVYQCIRTYVLFSFAMIFFRANSIRNAIQIIKSMFIWDAEANTLNFLDILDSIVLIVSLIILFVVGKIAKKENVVEKILEKKLISRWMIFYILIFSVIIFGCYGPGYDPASFIYRQF